MLRTRWMIAATAALAAASLFPAHDALAQARPAAGAPRAACPWVRSAAPIPQRVRQVVSAMTLDEKIAMVHGSAGSIYVGYVPAIPRLCIPALKLEDGPGASRTG